MDIELGTEERLALGSLLRVMIRLDADFSPAESAELERIASVLGPDLLWNAIDEAGHRPLDDESVEALAAAVRRPEARELIYGLLFDLAASDVISRPESTLLDWLRETWKIDSPGLNE